MLAMAGILSPSASPDTHFLFEERYQQLERNFNAVVQELQARPEGQPQQLQTLLKRMEAELRHQVLRAQGAGSGTAQRLVERESILQRNFEAAVALMDGIGALLIDRPAYILLIVALSFVANAGMQLFAVAPFLAIGKRRAFTIAFSAGNRNMAIILAVIPVGFMPNLELYLVLAQVPMYVLPSLLVPLYKWVFAKEINASE